MQKPERFKDICNHLSIGLTSLDRLQPLLVGLPLLVVLDFFLNELVFYIYPP